MLSKDDVIFSTDRTEPIEGPAPQPGAAQPAPAAIPDIRNNGAPAATEPARSPATERFLATYGTAPYEIYQRAMFDPTSHEYQVRQDAGHPEFAEQEGILAEARQAIWPAETPPVTEADIPRSEATGEKLFVDVGEYGHYRDAGLEAGLGAADVDQLAHAIEEDRGRRPATMADLEALWGAGAGFEVQAERAEKAMVAILKKARDPAVRAELEERFKHPSALLYGLLARKWARVKERT